MKYRVARRVSTRKSTDPESAEYGQWINLAPGQKVNVADLPDHAPVDEWVASGHLKPVKEKAA